MKEKKSKAGRRAFIRQVAWAGGMASAPASAAVPTAAAEAAPGSENPAYPWVEFPRRFAGRQLARIAFPLGGVAAGSISLGGRGQLRDWEVFNRPDKGNAPAYAFPAIWAQKGNGVPVARILESAILPPFEGSSGLGSNNVPGLPRLHAAIFTGEFPLARIDFQDPDLPVQVVLEAFTPFVPLRADDSGLPAAVLRYRVSNPGGETVKVSIVWCVDNPAGPESRPSSRQPPKDTRQNEIRQGKGIEGILMSNPGLAAADPMRGEFALTTPSAAGLEVRAWRGWPKGRWWNSPMLFWDDFRADGRLGEEPEARNQVGSLCLSGTLAPAAQAEFTFLLSWHFPNRTPERCGWRAPKGDESSLIGNHYCRRFSGAFAAAEHLAAELPRLEKYTRAFVAGLRASTLPAALKEAASANLSTLVSTTCFRTADGEFHGFEGVNDQAGCCFGNCTHVWNYETATDFLFPELARSLRRAAFGYSMDDAGAIHFRQLLPDGKERSGFAAADGQMGQIVKVYLDWRLSGDGAWLRALWPRVRKALEFAWVPGGWDADRDGVLEGVQHNTYDVEFFGPNPQCGIYYLAALRAAEEMAREVGEEASAAEYRRLFESGRQWTDARLFNGEYYVQQIRGVKKEAIAPSLMSSMGSENTEQPEFQLGEGCLVDQLVGQYLADVAGLGPLLAPGNIRRALESVYRYNHKEELSRHDSVQRTFALNDESALVICDYSKAARPRIPFPYYAEVMTGFEYSAAIAMIYAGLADEGIRCIQDIRRRYDGERRNPWDEAECGHHYARAMASWSALPAWSGFHYHGARGLLSLHPRGTMPSFTCFWSTATGWGTFSLTKQAGGMQLALRTDYGRLPLRILELPPVPKGASELRAESRSLAHTRIQEAEATRITLAEPFELPEGQTLHLRLG